MTRRLLILAGAAMAAVIAIDAQLSAQAKPAPGNGSANVSANATPAIVVPRELALEEQLQRMTDERNVAQDELDQLRLQVQQLNAVVVQVLENMRSERTKAATATRADISKKFLALLGCSAEKNDRWDWNRRGCVKADGAFIPLVKPDDKKADEKAAKKPEGPQ
jgi:hypothetical protein